MLQLLHHQLVRPCHALSLVILAAIAYAQNPPNRQAGAYLATAYNYDIDSSFYGAFGPYTFTRTACTNAVSLGTRALNPFNLNASVLVTDSTTVNTETVAFVSQTLNGGLCVLQLAVTKPHVSYHLTSGTYGLQEAINDATANGGGVVVVDARWRGTTAMITGAAGNSTVAIQDNRSGTPNGYQWTGSAYAVAAVGITGTGALGTQVVGTGSGHADQTRSVVDVRDWGIDCTGAADAAAILNSHTNVQDGIKGQHITIPNGCIISLQSDQWQIFGNEAWEIEGVGFLANLPLVQYCGPSGRDSILKIERSGGWTIKGVFFQEGTVGCTTNAPPNGIIVDNDRSGGYTATDGKFDRVQVSTSTAIANWNGISISPVSSSNVEDIRIYDSLIGCSGAGAAGVNLNSSFNAKLEDFSHTNFVLCSGGGIYQSNGSMILRGMDAFGNNGDVKLGAGSDPTILEGILSESPQIITTRSNAAANYPVTFFGDHEGWAGGNSAGLCGFDLTNAPGGSYLWLGSGIDAAPTATTFDICGTLSSHFTFVGTQLGSGANTTSSGQAGFVLPAGKSFGADYGFFNGGRMRMGNGANFGTEDIGYGFFTQYGAEIPGYGFNAQSLEDGHVPGTLSIGNDVMYAGNQNLTFKGMWPISMQSVTCVYSGTAGPTVWKVEVFAKDAAGNRGGLIALAGNGGNGTCSSAASTLDVSHTLTVVWPRVTSAASYDVVLLNPSNTSQGLLFGNVADPGSGQTATTTVNSGSTGSTFNYSFPNFYDSAITDVYGEKLALHLPLTLTSSTFANLPSAPSNGTMLYCSDCKNVTDDTTGTFDSVAASGGHGTNVLRENGAWRVH